MAAAAEKKLDSTGSASRSKMELAAVSAPAGCSHWVCSSYSRCQVEGESAFIYLFSIYAPCVLNQPNVILSLSLCVCVCVCVCVCYDLTIIFCSYTFSPSGIWRSSQATSDSLMIVRTPSPTWWLSSLNYTRAILIKSSVTYHDFNIYINVKYIVWIINQEMCA